VTVDAGSASVRLRVALAAFVVWVGGEG
jgi:hypothetical protein